jgi:DASH complex subunit DAD2
MSFGRPIPSHLRSGSINNASTSSNQSPALLARINEKKTELANLKELQALSAGLADQMALLEQKLSTLSDGTEGTSFRLEELAKTR